MQVTAYAQLVPLTNTGWTITGSGTAVQILQGNNQSNYLSAGPPVVPNTGVLVATNFGFAIPGGSTITGVSFGIGYKNTGASGPHASLTKDGSTPDGYSQAPSSSTWAGWGIGGFSGYTASEVNASTFGVMIDPATGTHFIDYLYVTITYVPSNYTYSGSAVFGFTTNSTYSFHQASGVNSWTYNGSAPFEFTTNTTYSFASGASNLPYSGAASTSPLYTGTASTAPLYSGTVSTKP